MGGSEKLNNMNKWNYFDNPELYKKVEILLNDGTITKDIMIKGKYGNYEWRDHVNYSVIAWRYIEESNNKELIKKENKTMMKNTRENRVATMQAAGIDTKKYFSINLPEGLKPGSVISLVIDENGKPAIAADTMKKEIKIDTELEQYNYIVSQIENGYVRNSKLHRRWVMAQMFRMLNSSIGYNEYLKRRYNYKYQFNMLIDELNVLGHLQKEDLEEFKGRSSFFNKNVVIALCNDYYEKLKKAVNNLPEKKCKGKPYKRINGYNIYVEDLNDKLYIPILNSIIGIQYCTSYKSLSNLLRNFVRIFVNKYTLPYDTNKCAAWVDAYKGSGAYYTMMNMVKFHNCFITDHTTGETYTGMKAVEYLKTLNVVHEEYGYRMFAEMKRMIKENHFDFNGKMREIYCGENE